MLLNPLYFNCLKRCLQNSLFPLHPKLNYKLKTRNIERFFHRSCPSSRTSLLICSFLGARWSTHHEWRVRYPAFLARKCDLAYLGSEIFGPGLAKDCPSQISRSRWHPDRSRSGSRHRSRMLEENVMHLCRKPKQNDDKVGKNGTELFLCIGLGVSWRTHVLLLSK